MFILFYIYYTLVIFGIINAIECIFRLNKIPATRVIQSQCRKNCVCIEEDIMRNKSHIIICPIQFILQEIKILLV